ncbi:hypothetical protein Leryth_025632 [Lithospermum erythrorhizon]|nr:hypothetical protein Leryth_025632 [Lithospermum erythrorhizon]
MVTGSFARFRGDPLGSNPTPSTVPTHNRQSTTTNKAKKENSEQYYRKKAVLKNCRSCLIQYHHHNPFQPHFLHHQFRFQVSYLLQILRPSSCSLYV